MAMPTITLHARFRRWKAARFAAGIIASLPFSRSRRVRMINWCLRRATIQMCDSDGNVLGSAVIGDHITFEGEALE